MAQQFKFCPQCGAQLSKSARFCNQCGQKLEAVTGSENKQQSSKGQNMSGPVQIQAKEAGEAVKSAGQVLKLGDFTAPSSSGEWELIEMAPVQEAVSSVSGMAYEIVETVTSPIETLLKSALSFVGGIFRTLIKPKNLLFALLLGGIWTYTGLNRYSDNPAANMLSFLTFGEGGFDREGLGLIGGIAGKGSVALMLYSIFSGGIPNTFKGAAGFFKKSEDKKSIPLFIIGILLGGFGYLAYAGLDNVSTLTSMAGISGAVLALQAIGKKDGWIYSIAQSFTAKKIDGIRTSQEGRITSFLGGISLGFAIITIIFAI